MSTLVDADRPPAELAVEVGDAYAEFCRGYRRLLDAIGEHDRCDAYRVLGMRNEVDYLCRTFDVRWHTAKDWEREARVIRTHPEIGDRLASGTLSIDRFRKMVEVVAEESPETVKPPGPFDSPPEPNGGTGTGGNDSADTTGGDDSTDTVGGDESAGDDDTDNAGGDGIGAERPLSVEELLAMLDDLSARQLAAKAAAVRAEAARRRGRYRTRHVHAVRFEGEGRLSLRGAELFDDDAAVVWAALEDYAGRVGKNPETGRRDPIQMRYADALRAMAEAYLARRERDLGHPLVVFHADARVLTAPAGWAASADHSPVDVATIRRLTCFAKVNVALDDPDGNPLFLGRTQRLASWLQEQSVIWRDGGCRGCGSTVGIEVHHLQEWTAEHGLTDVDQLIAACRTCHHLNHDQGWRFEGEANGEIVFVDPNGECRQRTRPHPRCRTKPRPPAEWRRDPPKTAADNAADATTAPPGDDAEPATLW